MNMPFYVAPEQVMKDRVFGDFIECGVWRGGATILMRGIVQLPDYLERLQSGHKDIPIVLLPLVNELRTARGEQADGFASGESAGGQIKDGL